MNLEKYLLLNVRNSAILIGAFIVFILIHNFIYSVFYVEEAFFFLLATFVIPLYLLISIVYTIIHKIKRKGRK